MLVKNSLLVVLFILSGVLCAQSSTDPYTHFISLDQKYQVQWRFNETDITFEVSATTKGFVGFGISPSGNLNDADFVVGGVRKDGSAYLKDCFINDAGVPELDNQQDWEFLSGQETPTQTILTFRRKLKTCDCTDQSIDEYTTTLLWKFGNKDAESSCGDQLSGIERSGQKKVLLLEEATAYTETPDDAFIFDLVNPNDKVPVTENIYWCNFYELPAQSEPHQLIKYEPIITPGNEHLIRHMEMSICLNPPVNESLLGQGGHCWDGGYYKLARQSFCHEIVAFWAIGGTEFNFPADIGRTILGPDTPRYVLSHTYFYNPQLLPVKRDSSGFRLTVTPTLRPIEAGIIAIGGIQFIAQVIPPYSDAFSQRFFCPKECTERHWTDNFTVIGAYLHADTIGRKIQTYHIRDGVLLNNSFGRDDRYDPYYQEYRILKEPVKVLKGDSLGIDCTYDASQKTKITPGGRYSPDETCIMYLLHYPVTTMRHCASLPYSEGLMKIAPEVQLDDYYMVIAPPEYVNLTWYEVLDQKVNWGDEGIRQDFQELTWNATRYGYCPYLDKDEEIEFNVDPPQVTPFEAEPTCDD